MRRGLLIFSLFVILTACKNTKGVPENIMPPKKMQAVLWDMMRADQFIADYMLSKNPAMNKTAESLTYYQQVFTIHQITKEDFQRSFEYYKSHPDLFRQILDSIAVLPVEKTGPPKLPDSAKAVIPALDTLVKKAQQQKPDMPKIRKRKRLLSNGG